MDYDCVKIDPTKIPEHVQYVLAAATLDFIKELINSPGGRELLNKHIERKKARQEANHQ